MDYKEPTSAQCNSNIVISETQKEIVFACWYPQMGGYCGKAIVIATKQPSKLNQCFDALVWHDGRFPFSGDSENPERRIENPIQIHHCSADQFIEFGETVKKLSGAK